MSTVEEERARKLGSLGFDRSIFTGGVLSDDDTSSAVCGNGPFFFAKSQQQQQGSGQCEAYVYILSY
eukprot:7447-Heterococcus_DN1.PRE.2